MNLFKLLLNKKIKHVAALPPFHCTSSPNVLTKGAEQIHSIYGHVKMIIGFVGDACGVCQQRMKLTIHRTTVVLCSKMNMSIYD